MHCKHTSTTGVAAEVEWVAMARRFVVGDHNNDDISEDDEEKDGWGGWGTWKMVTTVVRELAIVKPEACVPQMVAVGPHHRSRPELREMEWWKLSVVRTLQRRLCSGVTFVQVVDAITQHERAIRSHYQRYLCMDSETLAWTMAIDATFVLEFLHSYTYNTTVAHDPCNAAILTDLLRLENQIPLFLLEVVSNHLFPREDNNNLAVLLANFVKRVHPFQLEATGTSDAAATDVQTLLLKETTRRHQHLLHLLHSTIMPENQHYYFHSSSGSEETNGRSTEYDPKTCPARSSVLLLLGCFKSVLFSFFIRMISVTFGCFPMVAIMAKAPLGQILTQSSTSSCNGAEDYNDERFEMDIPSASDLAEAGVRFVATNGGLSSIAFDVKLGNFFIPAIRMEPHTEVMLRNLVAVELVAWRQNQRRPWVLAWYVQLMKGIVDAAEDVRVLRQCGVLRCPDRSDEAVAQMWNGMSMGRSTGGWSNFGMGPHFEVMDELLRSVNVWYKGRLWKVRVRRMLLRTTKKVGSSFDFSKLSSVAFLCLAVVLVAMHVFCFFHHCGV